MRGIDITGNDAAREDIQSHRQKKAGPGGALYRTWQEDRTAVPPSELHCRTHETCFATTDTDCRHMIKEPK